MLRTGTRFYLKISGCSAREPFFSTKSGCSVRAHGECEDQTAPRHHRGGPPFADSHRTTDDWAGVLHVSAPSVLDLALGLCTLHSFCAQQSRPGQRHNSCIQRWLAYRKAICSLIPRRPLRQDGPSCAGEPFVHPPVLARAFCIARGPRSGRKRIGTPGQMQQFGQSWGRAKLRWRAHVLPIRRLAA